MKNPGSARKFVAAFFAAIVFSITAMVAVNIIVDPFWRFDLVNIPGFNEPRSQFANRARMAKAGVVCRLQPATVILGTSRVEVGMDPMHPALRDAQGPAYNMALAGSGLHELDLTLRHAVYASPRLKRVFLGLDFLMFNAHREATVFGTEVLDFDENRLVLSKNDSCVRSLIQDLDDVLGPKALMFSAATVTNQFTEPLKFGAPNLAQWLAVYNRDGFRANFDILDKIQSPRLGYRGLYGDAQERAYVGKVWRPPPEQRYCFAREDQPSTFETFRGMIRFARASGIDLRIFINPVHARLLIALREAGLWPQYEEWKRGMVEVLAAEAAEAGNSQFPLWDFSGFNSVTIEHVPPKEDKTTILRGFWEPSHYKSGIGTMMLNVMTETPQPTDSPPADFGVYLTPTTLENWISKSRLAMQQYIRTEAEETALVRSTVEKVMAGSEGANCGHDVEALRKASQAAIRGDKANAETAFAHAIALHEADRRYHGMLDVPYRESGFDRLLAQATAGVELKPRLRTWLAYHDRGMQRLSAGDNLGAADDFALAIRIGPVNTALHYLRGLALLNAKQMPDAASEFELGLKLDPTNPTMTQLLKQARGTQDAR